MFTVTLTSPALPTATVVGYADDLQSAHDIAIGHVWTFGVIGIAGEPPFRFDRLRSDLDKSGRFTWNGHIAHVRPSQSADFA